MTEQPMLTGLSGRALSCQHFACEEANMEHVEQYSRHSFAVFDNYYTYGNT